MDSYIDDEPADPVVGLHGLRTFRVSTNGRLIPVTMMSDDWAAGWCIARCGRAHPAPAVECSCGIYSFQNWRELRVQYPMPSTRLIAVVALEGITVEGRKGYRSQAARVTDMWLRSGRFGLPEHTTALLRVNYPLVRFHTDLTGMLTAYPELPNPGRPRRELLARAALQSQLAARWPADGWLMPGLIGGAATGLAAVFSWLISIPDHPALGGQLALAGSTALALMAFILVAAELPLQMVMVAAIGVSPPLLFAPRRPILAMGRLGLITALAGAAAAGLHGSTESLWLGVALAGTWLVMMGLELFMVQIAPGRQPAPWRTFAAGAHPAIETRGWLPERTATGHRRRWPRRGVWPVVINPPTQGE